MMPEPKIKQFATEQPEDPAVYAAGVAASSGLPTYMTLEQTREHCRRVLGL